MYSLNVRLVLFVISEGYCQEIGEGDQGCGKQLEKSRRATEDKDGQDQTNRKGKVG